MKRSFDAPNQTGVAGLAGTGPCCAVVLRRPGWSMPVCEMDMRVGGKYRWRQPRDERPGVRIHWRGSGDPLARENRACTVFDAGDLGVSMGSEPSIITVTFQETSGITNVTTTIQIRLEGGPRRRVRNRHDRRDGGELQTARRSAGRG
ncbi:MAG: SRPBCC domain-containing protein [Gemmataceae bacterium]